MNGAQPTERSWFIQLAPGSAHLRCAIRRLGKTVERFTVQLEVWHADAWWVVARYDNAHGFCHRDTLHPDGTQDKTSVFVGDTNATFTHAIADFRASWKSQRDRFLREKEA